MIGKMTHNSDFNIASNCSQPQFTLELRSHCRNTKRNVYRYSILLIFRTGFLHNQKGHAVFFPNSMRQCARHSTKLTDFLTDLLLLPLSNQYLYSV